MNTTEQQAEIREALSEKFEDMDIDDLSPYEDMIDLIVKYGNPDMDLFPDDFLTPDGKNETVCTILSRESKSTI